MSLPIAPTPTLYGKEAIDFIKRAKKAEKEVISEKEFNDCINSFIAVCNSCKGLEGII